MSDTNPFNWASMPPKELKRRLKELYKKLGGDTGYSEEEEATLSEAITRLDELTDMVDARIYTPDE